MTFPSELRGNLGFDSKLLSSVSRVVVDSIRGCYERRMRDCRGPLTPIAVARPLKAGDREASTKAPTKSRRPKLQSGTVTAVQRVNSDFRLSPHLHVLALDGVFVEQRDGSPLRSATSSQVYRGRR